MLPRSNHRRRFPFFITIFFTSPKPTVHSRLSVLDSFFRQLTASLNHLQDKPSNPIPSSTMSDNNKNAPSTLQSYVDSATGAVQSAIGSLTGNTGDRAQGEVRKDAAQTEHNASQAAVKVPGATVSSDGGVAKDDPNRSQGSWNQTVGSAKEAVGGLVGSDVCLLPSPLVSVP